MLRHQNVLDVPPQALSAGMGLADWPARLQHLGRGPLTDLLPPGSELWLDGGHNPAAARLVAEHLQDQWTDDLPSMLVFASLAAKDALGMLKPFVRLRPRIFAVPIEGHDCRHPAELASIANDLGLQAQPATDLPRALATITEPARVLIFGSLYLAGEALAANGEQPN